MTKEELRIKRNDEIAIQIKTISTHILDENKLHGNNEFSIWLDYDDLDEIAKGVYKNTDYIITVNVHQYQGFIAWKIDSYQD